MYFDAQPPIERPVLHLARPDRKIVSRLSEAIDETEIFNLGQLTELTFSVPLKYETLEENKVNLNAQKLLERMLIRLRSKGKERWYIISSRNIDVDSRRAMITAKSTAYTLSDIPIKAFSTVENEHPDGLDYSSWTLSEIVRETIDRDEDTMWRLGDVDVEFDLKRREFTHDGSLGELVVAVAEKFGAVPIYDDLNSKIHFKHPDKIGRNRGLKLTYKNYLLSMSKDSNSDNLATQLALYGSEGLTIREINPTGSTYIEDFSYFLYPYQEDANGNVIKSSMFMSDSLAGAIVKYTKKIETLTPSFQTILAQLETYMKDIGNLEIDLSIQDTLLVQKQEQIDIWLGTNDGKSNPTYESEKAVIVAEMNRINSLIQSKKTQIASLAGEDYYESGYVELGNIGGQLGLLKQQLLVRNNFTPEQIKERSYYVIRKEWSNDSIVDPKELLEEGRKSFKDFSKPSLNVNLSVVDFLSALEVPLVHKELYLGDTVRTEDDWEHRVLEGKILGFTRNYYEKSLSIQIANFAKEEDGADKFLKMIYQASFAATVVNDNKYKWDLSKDNNGTLNAIINDNFDAVKKKVTGGAAGLTEFSARGLTSRDYDNNSKYLVVQNGVLALTKDNGVNWGVAITPDGIVAERVMGKLIAGVNVTIEDQDGIMRILGNKLSISNRNKQEVIKLGLISPEGTPDRFGLVVDNRKNQIGIVEDDGFYISRYIGGSIEKLLWTDIDGNLNTQKITATDMKIVNAEMRSGTVKNISGNTVVEFGTFGMKIDGGSLQMTSGDNGLRLNTTEGLVSESSSMRISMNSREGLKMWRKTDEIDVFTLDTNGRVVLQDVLVKSGSIINENSTHLIQINPSVGMRIYNKSLAKNVFYVDSNGKLTLKDVVIDGGAINWNNTNSKEVKWGDIFGKPNVPNGTYIDQDGLYTGTIAANRISAGTISGLSFNTFDSTTTGQIIMNGGHFTSNKYNTNGQEYTKISNGGMAIRAYSSGTSSYQNISLDGNYGLSFTTSKYPSSRLRIDSTESSYSPKYIIQATRGTESYADIEIKATSILLRADGFSDGIGNVFMNDYQVASVNWVYNQNYIDTATGKSLYASKSHTHSDYWSKGSDSGYLSSSVYIGGASIGVGGTFDGSTGTSNVSIGATNIYAPGKVYASGVALTSSVTRKTNIREFDMDAIDVIKGVNVYEYHYINDVDNLNFYNKQIGVLAEGSPAILRGGENDSINTYAMVSVLWKAMQQQSEVIDTLKRDIKELEEIIGTDVTESY